MLSENPLFELDKRLEFCENFVKFSEESSDFPDRILWSDEACFKQNGHVNRHNCVYWDSENPHHIIETEVNVPGVTIWGGICSTGLVGPFFFEGTVNGARYLDMLKTKVFPIVKEFPHFGDLHFQQDGAPAHYTKDVRQWLDESFPGCWIGHRGPIEWPARSPDLTLPDFFLWGVLKNAVYANKPRTIDQLKQNIQHEWNQISEETCQKVCRSVVKRCRDCIEVQGRHFEHL